MHTTWKRLVGAIVAATALVTLGGCDKSSSGGGTQQGNAPSPSAPSATDFRLLAGSENKDLEPIFQRFAAQQNVKLTTKYAGSVDISLQIQSGAGDTDAVLPASSLWIQISDQQHVVKNATSLMRSPVVYGVKMSVAKSLHWDNNPKVTVSDILAAAEAGKIRTAMTSATQSNTGTCAYFGMLSANAGHPDVLLSSHLNDNAVQAKTGRLLSSLERSSGSSGWLKDMLIKDPDAFDTMVNYEAMVIAANRDLESQRREPLCAVYPVDGVMIADFPLGYVDHGDAGKAKFFADLQTYLLSAPVQAEIAATGRRVGVGMDANADPNVFRNSWCIDTKRVITTVPTPSEPVVREALELYQTLLRKPSFSVFVLDYSGSMAGEREAAMKKAMETVLEPNIAKRYMLQPSKRDVNIVLPFSGEVQAAWQVEGNDAASLRQLLGRIKENGPNGGTSLYTAVAGALDTIAKYDAAHKNRDDARHLSRYFPAVIVLTDGEATDNRGILDAYLADHPAARDVPIFSIQFGDANQSQLNQLSQRGRVFDGTKDVGKAIREAKQYN